MKDRLELSTLGGLSIRVGGRPVSGLASRKAEALLVYLACTRRTHARESLATLLWDDRPQSRALGNLSVLLTSLRKQVGTHLQITRHTLALKDESEHWLDVAELETQLDLWREERDRGEDPSRAAAQGLERAIELYQGDFLAGFHLRSSRGFEEWALLERERLSRRVIRGLTALMAFHSRNGELGAALENSRRLLEIDPFQEDVHRTRMILLARDGQRQAALEQYLACRQVLAEELGVEPSAETTALCERIRNIGRRPRHSLPAHPAPFIGRRSELASIRRRLLDPRCRLLTIVGAGGMGKTRLALQAAEPLAEVFLEGVCFMDLAPLEDAALVGRGLASALGLRSADWGVGVIPAGERHMLDRLIDYLHAKETLLILDNCEHLLETCAQLSAELLKACPGLKILATSRVHLGVAGEVVWQAPPMQLPKEDGTPAQLWAEVVNSDATRFFAERAMSVQPAFVFNQDAISAVAQICRRLDGMPLGIELAAARLKALSPGEICRRLDDRFELLTGGDRTAIPRHQTLEAAMAWSYDLLEEEERRLFDRLSVFRGGFTLQAVERVCSGEGIESGRVLDLLSRLVEQSLIVVREDQQSTSRYRLLETLRHYGKENLLRRGESETLSVRHSAHFLAFAEEAKPLLVSREQKIWLRRLEDEHDNLRAALRRSAEAGEVEILLRMAAALWESFWLNQGYFEEGRDWLLTTLEASAGQQSHLRAEALLGEAALAWAQGDYEAAAKGLELSIALGRETGGDGVIAWCQYYLGVIAGYNRADYSEAVGRFEESLSLFRKLGDRRGEAWQLFQLGQMARLQGDSDAAEAYCAESLVVLEEVGDLWGIGWALGVLGMLALSRSDQAMAVSLGRQSLDHFRQLENSRGTAFSLVCLGLAVRGESDYEQAVALLEEALELHREVGDVANVARDLGYLGMIVRLQGDYERARALTADSLRMLRDLGDRHAIATVIGIAAGLACAQKEFARAARLFGAAEALREAIGIPVAPFERATYDREVAETREGLLQPAFAQAWEAGEAMELEEAVAYALGEAPEG